MFPSSAIQIVEQTASRLVIYDPPFYSMGLLFLAIGIFDLFTGIPLYLSTAKRIVLLVTLVLGAAGILVGAALLAPRSYITFSRDSGQVTIQRRYFGLVRAERNLPLDSLQKAVVETTSSNARRIALIPHAGEPVLLDSYTSREGQYTAVNAINRFLGVP